MNRLAQAVVMLLLGGAVLKISLTDLYLRYVKEGLRPFLILAGALLVAAAVMTAWYDLRRGAVRDTECADGSPHDGQPHDGQRRDGQPHDGHAHQHREPRVGWLLILPALGLLLVVPPALGSYAAGNAGTALSAQQISDFPPLPEGDPAEITVLDYASRAVFDEGRSLGDRRVKLTGFIAREEDGTQFLARIVLSCCAADGRPIKVGMSGAAPGGLAADTWVEVVGRYVPESATDPVNGEKIPYLAVESWGEVPAPKQQYE